MRIVVARVPFLGVASVIAALALPACAHQMGASAVTGAAQTVAEGQKNNADDPSAQITRVAAERAIAGAVAALDAPEQRAKLDSVVNQLVSEAIASAFKTATEVPPGQRGARGGAGVSPVALLIGQAARSGIETAIQQVVDDLGGKGQGPLSQSIAASGQKVSAAVVGSVLGQLADLFPGCRGPNAVDCIDRQLQKTSHAAGVGFAQGVRDSIGWQVLVAVGLLGLLAGILAHRLWSLRVQGRPLRTRTT